MREALQRFIAEATSIIATCLRTLATIRSTLQAVGSLCSELRQFGLPVLQRLRPGGIIVAYENLWLDLVFDITDAHGERVVLTRRQRVCFLTPGVTIVRELVWGDGEPLARYRARGARRIAERFEGSKRAVLLEPDRAPAPGTCVTITSRRTMRRAFLAAEEYCEAFLERPTGRLDVTVRFPATRPPRGARLVAATTERLLRTVAVRYGADGRPVLRCRIQKPAIGTIYSLRWSW